MSRHIPLHSAIALCLLVALLPAPARPQEEVRPTKEERRRIFDQWLKEDGELARQWHTAWTRYHAAAPNSPEKEAQQAEMRRVAAARKALRLQRLKTEAPGEDEPAAEEAPPAGHRPVARLEGANGTAVAFSPDGGRLLVAGAREARVWDARTFEPVGGDIRHGAGVWSASFSRNGAYVLTAGGKSVRVWDVAPGKPPVELPHPAEVRCAAFSGDGARVVTGCDDKRVRVWDARSGKPVETASAMEHANPVRFVAFAAGGELVVSADTWRREPGGRDRSDAPAGLEVRAWDAATGKQAWSYARRKPFGALSDVVLSADGGKLLVIDEAWRYGEVLDARTGRSLVRLEEAEGPEVVHPTFSRDGLKIAIGEWGQVGVWDAAGGKLAGAKLGGDVRDWVKRLAFSPDGRLLLVCARSGQYGIDSQLSGVWDLASGRRVLSIPYGEVSAGAFSPDGRFVAVGGKTPSASETTVWEVPRAGAAVADAGPLKTIPATLPKEGDPDWDDVYGYFAESDLPKDVPLPAATPFDADPALRKDYHDGYRLGFVSALLGTMAVDDDSVDGKAAAFRKGYGDGRVPAYKLNTLREKVEHERQFASVGGKLVSDDAPEADRRVLESFRAFAAEFEKAFRAALPDTVAAEVVGVPRLYALEFDDYSRDNTGKAVRAREFTGVLDSRRRNNLDWMRVKPKDPARPGAHDKELEGLYGFRFVYDPAADTWSMGRHPHSPHDDGYEYRHYQQTDREGRVFEGRDFPFVRSLVLKAVADARAAHGRARAAGR